MMPTQTASSDPSAEALGEGTITSDPKFQLRARRRLTGLIDRALEGIPDWVLLVTGTVVWAAILLYLTIAATSGPTP
jgi:hypothetical protein